MMRRVRAPRSAGMALVVVLWIVAAMSVLVTGLILTTRAQVSTVAAGRDAAVGQALGDAAIAITLQALLVTTPMPNGVQTVPVTYADQTLQVEVAPLNGLISLNGAGPPLLAAMLQGGGGLPPAVAEDMAQQMVVWRSEVPQLQTPGIVSGPRMFEAPEDLLLFPGIGYDLYARLAPLVTADLRTNRVNAQAAPPEVLAALAPGDAGRIAQFIAARGGDQPADSSFFDTNLISSGSSAGRFYRVRVKVPLDAGKILVLTRDVALVNAPSTLLPWRLLRQSRQVQSSGAS